MLGRGLVGFGTGESEELEATMPRLLGRAGVVIYGIGAGDED